MHASAVCEAAPNFYCYLIHYFLPCEENLSLREEYQVKEYPQAIAAGSQSWHHT